MPIDELLLQRVKDNDPNLTTLHLNLNTLDRDCITKLENALSNNTKVTTLKLSNQIFEESIDNLKNPLRLEYLAAMLTKTSINKFELDEQRRCSSYCPPRTVGVNLNILLKVLPQTRITNLNLSSMDLAAGMEPLIKILPQCHITHLHLNGYNGLLYDSPAQDLFRILPKTQINDFTFFANFGDPAIFVLAELLPNTCLTHLTLSGLFSDKGFEKLVNVLNNTSIVYFNIIPGPKMSKDGFFHNRRVAKAKDIIKRNAEKKEKKVAAEVESANSLVTASAPKKLLGQLIEPLVVGHTSTVLALQKTGIVLELPPGLTKFSNFSNVFKNLFSSSTQLTQNRLLGIESSGKVHTWNIQDGKYLITLDTLTDRHPHLANNLYRSTEIPNNRLVLGGFDTEPEAIYIWDLKNGSCIVNPKSKPLSSADKSKLLFNDYFVIYGASGLRVWCATTGKLLYKLIEKQRVYEVIPWTEHRFIIIKGWAGENVDLWSLKNGQSSKIMALPIKDVSEGIVLPNNHLVFITFDDVKKTFSLILWNGQTDYSTILTTSPVVNYSQPTVYILRNPRVSSSGRYLVIDGAGIIVIWDILERRFLPNITSPGKTFSEMQLLPYDLIATNNYENFSIWDIKSAKCLKSSSWKQSCTNFQFLSNNHILVVDNGVPYLYQFNSLESLLLMVSLSFYTLSSVPTLQVADHKNESVPISNAVVLNPQSKQSNPIPSFEQKRELPKEQTLKAVAPSSNLVTLASIISESKTHCDQSLEMTEDPIVRIPLEQPNGLVGTVIPRSTVLLSQDRIAIKCGNGNDERDDNYREFYHVWGSQTGKYFQCFGMTTNLTAPCYEIEGNNLVIHSYGRILNGPTECTIWNFKTNEPVSKAGVKQHYPDFYGKRIELSKQYFITSDAFGKDTTLRIWERHFTSSRYRGLVVTYKLIQLISKNQYCHVVPLEDKDASFVTYPNISEKGNTELWTLQGGLWQKVKNLSITNVWQAVLLPHHRIAFTTTACPQGGFCKQLGAPHDSSIQIWKADNEQWTTLYKMHEGGNLITFSGSEYLLARSGYDKVLVWDTTIFTHYTIANSEKILSLALLENNLIAIMDCKSLKIIEAKSGKHLGELLSPVGMNYQYYDIQILKNGLIVAKNDEGESFLFQTNPYAKSFEFPKGMTLATVPVRKMEHDVTAQPKPSISQSSAPNHISEDEDKEIDPFATVKLNQSVDPVAGIVLPGFDELNSAPTGNLTSDLLGTDPFQDHEWEDEPTIVFHSSNATTMNSDGLIEQKRATTNALPLTSSSPIVPEQKPASLNLTSEAIQYLNELQASGVQPTKFQEFQEQFSKLLAGQQLLAEEIQLINGWLSECLLKLSASQTQLDTVSKTLEQDPRTKREQDYIDSQPNLKDYQQCFQRELCSFITCFYLAPNGLFQLAPNKKQKILSAITDIPVAGEYLKILTLGLTAVLSGAIEKQRFYQMNRLCVSFKDTMDIARVSSILARQITLVKRKTIQALKEVEYRGVVGKVKELYQTVKETLEQQWNGLQISNKTGIALNAAKKMAVLDVARFLQEFLTQEQVIAADSQNRVEQFVMLITGEPFDLSHTQLPSTSPVTSPTSMEHNLTSSPMPPEWKKLIEDQVETLVAQRLSSKQKEMKQAEVANKVTTPGQALYANFALSLSPAILNAKKNTLKKISQITTATSANATTPTVSSPATILTEAKHQTVAKPQTTFEKADTELQIVFQQILNYHFTNHSHSPFFASCLAHACSDYFLQLIRLVSYSEHFINRKKFVENYQKSSGLLLNVDNARFGLQRLLGLDLTQTTPQLGQKVFQYLICFANNFVTRYQDPLTRIMPKDYQTLAASCVRRLHQHWQILIANGKLEDKQFCDAVLVGIECGIDSQKTAIELRFDTRIMNIVINDWFKQIGVQKKTLYHTHYYHPPLLLGQPIVGYRHESPGETLPAEWKKEDKTELQPQVTAFLNALDTYYKVRAQEGLGKLGIETGDVKKRRIFISSVKTYIAQSNSGALAEHLADKNISCFAGYRTRRLPTLIEEHRDKLALSQPRL